MFCCTLRQRPSFAPVVAQLAPSSGLGMRESQLDLYDVALQLGPGSLSSCRKLRILLLSPSDVAADKLNPTMDRIRQLSVMSRGQDIAIVFLLSLPRDTEFQSAKGMVEPNANVNRDGVGAYSQLHVELLNRVDLPSIPILPLSALDDLAGVFKKHATALTTHPAPTRAGAQPTAYDLLSQCIVGTPMPEQTAMLLSDLFPDLRSLAEACSTVTSAPTSSSPSVRAIAAEGLAIGDGFDVRDLHMADYDTAHGKLKQLRHLVGDEQWRNIVDFWKEEWAAE